MAEIAFRPRKFVQELEIVKDRLNEATFCVGNLA